MHNRFASRSLTSERLKPKKIKEGWTEWNNLQSVNEKKLRNGITIDRELDREISLDETEIKPWLSVAKLSDVKLSDEHL